MMKVLDCVCYGLPGNLLASNLKNATTRVLKKLWHIADLITMTYINMWSYSEKI